MGREIRRVPKNWKHLREVNNHTGEVGYKPMYQGDFGETYKDWNTELPTWYKEYKKWEAGEFKHDKYSKDCKTYEDYAGPPPSPPSPYDYMPKGEWYQLFETVSEGDKLKIKYLDIIDTEDNGKRLIQPTKLTPQKNEKIIGNGKEK